MNSVNINKLEWDILNNIDDGKTDEQIVSFIFGSTTTEVDLVKVIRNLYEELKGAYKELEK